MNQVIRNNWPLFLAGAVVILGLAIFGFRLKWDGLILTVKVTDLASILAPLAFASAVIERAVEILISPWRDAEANKLGRAVAVAQALNKVAPTAQNAADSLAAANKLEEYKGETQKYAFAVSLTLSLIASIAGVRAFWPFAAAAKFSDPSQQTFFLCVDVGLSAALLSGGADGVHSVLNAVTTFFKASADNSRQPNQ